MSRKKKHEHVNHERWLVSYADFITLLFAFFVVLFASSQADKKKQSQVAAAMQTAFRPLGTFDAHSNTPPIADASAAQAVTHPVPIALPLNTAMIEQTLERIHRIVETQQSTGKALPPGSITTRITNEGLIVSLNEIGFFDSGSADVRPAALEILYALAKTLPDTALRVEGHTDNVPIHTAQYTTNWELSTARASTIARLLLLNSTLHPANLAAAGYAEFHPIAPNTTEEGRSRNRRVDIVILKDRAPSQ